MSKKLLPYHVHANCHVFVMYLAMCLRCILCMLCVYYMSAKCIAIILLHSILRVCQDARMHVSYDFVLHYAMLSITSPNAFTLCITVTCVIIRWLSVAAPALCMHSCDMFFSLHVFYFF